MHKNRDERPIQLLTRVILILRFSFYKRRVRIIATFASVREILLFMNIHVRRRAQE